MKGWKSYLWWEGLPILLPLFFFGIISAVNWDYESKLITPNNSDSSNWSDSHIGLIFLRIAMIQAIVASFLLFVVRIIAIRIPRPSISMAFMFVSLTFIVIIFIFPSLFITIVMPAFLTMAEQVRVSPR